MNSSEIYNAAQLIERIQQIGFLPLLDSGIVGFSAEEMVDDDCRYVLLPDGGWDWPLWKWKGPIVTEGNCVYGKFFAGKAVFMTMFVGWIDKILGTDIATHLQSCNKTIEPAAHLRTSKATGSTQLTGNHTAVQLKG